MQSFYLDQIDETAFFCVMSVCFSEGFAHFTLR